MKLLSHFGNNCKFRQPSIQLYIASQKNGSEIKGIVFYLWRYTYPTALKGKRRHHTPFYFLSVLPRKVLNVFPTSVHSERVLCPCPQSQEWS